jgi:hypothetical protein
MNPEVRGAVLVTGFFLLVFALMVWGWGLR